MKKTMSVLLILALISAVSTSALSESHVAIMRSGKIVKVIYKSTERADVKVTISDANGEKVFSEQLNSVDGFIRPYNFSELPKGDYTVCVTDVGGKKTEKICFDEERMAKREWVTHMSHVQNNRNKVLVVVPKQDVNHFSVMIYDENDRLIYNEDPKVEKEYARVFHLKNMEHGATVNLVNHVTGETKSFRAE